VNLIELCPWRGLVLPTVEVRLLLPDSQYF